MCALALLTNALMSSSALAAVDESLMMHVSSLKWEPDLLSPPLSSSLYCCAVEGAAERGSIASMGGELSLVLLLCG